VIGNSQQMKVRAPFNFVGIGYQAVFPSDYVSLTARTKAKVAPAAYSVNMVAYQSTNNAALSFLHGRASYIPDTADWSSIHGGWRNTAQTNYNTVIGGKRVRAIAHYTTMIGGLNNLVSGRFATVIGGSGNTARGRFSFAAGRRARAMSDYSAALQFTSQFGICRTQTESSIKICTDKLYINNENVFNLFAGQNRRRELEGLTAAGNTTSAFDGYDRETIMRIERVTKDIQIDIDKKRERLANLRQNIAALADTLPNLPDSEVK